MFWGKSCNLAKRLFAQLGQAVSHQYEIDNLLDEIASLNETIRVSDAHIDSLNQEVAEREAQIGSLNQAVADQDAHIGSLNQAVTDRDALIASLNHAVALLKQAVAQREAQLSSLFQSRSWRVTAPLRYFGRKLKGQSGLVGQVATKKNAEVLLLRKRLRQICKILYWIATLQIHRKVSAFLNARSEARSFKLPHDTIPVAYSASSMLLGEGECRLLAEACQTPKGAAIVEPEKFSPLISIVLPTYNTPSRYLKELVQSIQNQSYTNWELCIVDDASNNFRCRERLSQIAESDGRIHLRFNEINQGIAVSSQRTAEMAKGEYIAFVDHDDILAPSALSIVVEKLREDPMIDMIYSDHALMSDQGDMLSAELKPNWSPEFLLTTNYIVHLKVIRRKTFSQIGGFRNTLHMSQDYGLILKLLAADAKVVHVNGILYFWRVHHKSTSNGSSAKPDITSSAIMTINNFLKSKNIPATATWPSYFQKADCGAYKLEFSHIQNHKPSIIIPIDDENQPSHLFFESLGNTHAAILADIHLVVLDGSHAPHATGLYTHTVSNQEEFDRFVERLETEHVVFVSPTSKFISADWLRELTGYLTVSPRIGAVGGKILNSSLDVQGGGTLFLENLPVIAYGQPDTADGYWFTNQIVSNVEAVSSLLMSTRKSVYKEIGGLPIFSYGNDAGIAYCIKLSKAGYRIVYNPWAKTVNLRFLQHLPGIERRLIADFGLDTLNDSYYHSWFDQSIPYEIT